MRLIDADALRNIFAGQPPEYYATGYLIGLIDRLPTVSGWVSVKERLPDEDGSTLICTKNGKVCTARFYKRQGGWNAYAGRNAAYWKPLPEPPKEVSKDG